MLFWVMFWIQSLNNVIQKDVMNTVSKKINLSDVEYYL